MMRYLVFLLLLWATSCSSHGGKIASTQIIITSGIHNSDRRHACRLTWLKWVKHFAHGISYAFHVEAPINDVERAKISDEAYIFKDIVVMNATAPRDKSEASCSFRRWEALSYEFNQLPASDYYLFADDDSFICIHHLLFDSKFWPVGTRVHISHFKKAYPDVISIYSNMLVKDALQILNRNPVYKSKTVQDMVKSGALKDVDNINEVRLSFGSRGTGSGRYNDFVNGWIGGDLLNATAKTTICNSVLSLHQAYPNIMIDLWSHITGMPSPEEFSEPGLSRNVEDLDSTRGDY